MPHDVTFRRAEHLAWRRVVDETVVLDLESRRVFGLAAEAAALLAALAAPRNLTELVRQLAADEDEATAGARLSRSLAELCAEGLVVAEGAAALACAGSRAGDAAEPAVLWQEQLEEVTQQVSPPMQIGNPQCLQ